MNAELKIHIKKLQNRAIFSLIAILLTIISIAFMVLLLLVPSFAAIIFFAVAAIGVVYLIHTSRTAKKETKGRDYKPVVFNLNKPITFEEMVSVFENLTDKDKQLCTSNDIRFFRLRKMLKLRVVLYRTADFNKKEFDSAKDRINKKANKELNISHWVNRMEAGKMMRFNIIYTDTLNDSLYQLLSKNANRSLTRVEGIINIAVIGNQIMIPQLYGDCDLAEISRYKGVIKFINQVIVNNS